MYANRILVEEAAELGGLSDCCVSTCDISNLRFNSCLWQGAELRDVSADGLVFLKSGVRKSLIFRSGLHGMSFTSSWMNDVTLDSLVLIKSRWQESLLKNVTLRSSCLQRAEFRRMKIASSSFTDFEAIESLLENCVAAHSLFAITYGTGMNGFSGAHIRNCIFYGCRFEGFPLRGAVLENCLFIRCVGETGCDSEHINTRLPAEPVSYTRRAEAEQLLARFA
jgi:uncharacterized protein YjbI with pentapeptide repeats